MKKIHLISKTHLDLGFTDYAKKVLEQYRAKYIPLAAELAEELVDKFVWTTGSYLIRDSLRNASIKNQHILDAAVKNGAIVWHALPFTTHTELITEELFGYALSIAKELDKKYKKHTISAKMTDVPGHTIAMLPYLHKAGIRFLHIGVNNASSVPDVPREFLWKYGDAEIVVVYEGAYGGIYQNKYIDDILCFLHSSDNCGPSSKAEVEKTYKELAEKYPDYKIAPSTLDEYGRAIWAVKDKLPVLTCEIGDSWIHGVGTDPYKVAAYRELSLALKEWRASGLLNEKDKAYDAFCENLLLITEHTWGMDVKRYLADYDNYLKADFLKAREYDKVRRRLGNIFKSTMQKYFDFKERRRGQYSKGSYSGIEYSWTEQREYTEKAIAALPVKLQKDAKDRIATLVPKAGFALQGYQEGKLHSVYKIGNFQLQFNESGLDKVVHNQATVLESSGALPFIRYASYGAKDYEEYKQTYARDYENCKVWIAPDFHKPGLKYAEGKYPEGDFSYKLALLLINEKKNSIIAQFTMDDNVSKQCGAPRQFQAKFSAKQEGLKIELIWLDKDASRLPEALWVNFAIKADKDSLRYIKLGESIDPLDIVPSGNRNLAAIEKAVFTNEGKGWELINMHSPLVAIGKGKVLRFDNEYGDITQGLSFNLYNNLWGTNFPLWYDQNAYFGYILLPKGG